MRYTIFVWTSGKNFPCKELSFFYKQHFYSTQSQCCLTFSWIERQMLLRCCLIHVSKHHHTNTLFIFTIFVFMSRPRSIYAVFMWSFFHFHLIMSNSLIEKFPIYRSRDIKKSSISWHNFSKKAKILIFITDIC